MTEFGVRAPASSANVGPGFDALGLALGLYLDIHVGATAPVDANRGGDGPLWDHDEHHLAIRTFRAAGGTGPVAARAEFAGGRGLGFSGAARVAGVFGACVQQGADVQEARATAHREASRLESHGDNASASAFGGLAAVAGDTVVSVPINMVPAVVVWVPQAETSTKTSRTLLPEAVSFVDAVFNVGRVATLVGAFASGNTIALRAAAQDRLHQDLRLDRTPTSRVALDAMLSAGAWCAWLSGSGPSVAALCAPDDAAAIVNVLPSDGRGVVCDIDHEGVRLQ